MRPSARPAMRWAGGSPPRLAAEPEPLDEKWEPWPPSHGGLPGRRSGPEETGRRAPSLCFTDAAPVDAVAARGRVVCAAASIRTFEIETPTAGCRTASVSRVGFPWTMTIGSTRFRAASAAVGVIQIPASGSTKRPSRVGATDAAGADVAWTFSGVVWPPVAEAAAAAGAAGGGAALGGGEVDATSLDSDELFSS